MTRRLHGTAVTMLPISQGSQASQQDRSAARLSLLLGSLLLSSLAVAGCSHGQRQGVSAEGKRLCLEQLAQMEPGVPLEHKRSAYRTCLKTIEAERARRASTVAQENRDVIAQEQEAQRAEASTWASQPERMVHCRLHQQEIVSAERDRQRALGPVMEITRLHGVNSPEAETANAAYQEHVAELERLIPPSMRRGRNLIPDSVRTFSRCDPTDFAQDSRPRAQTPPQTPE